MESANTETQKTLKESVIDINKKLSDAGKQAIDTTKKVVEEVGVSGQEVIKTCAETGKRQISNLEDYIKENPLKSVLCSVAAGFVINRLMRN